MPAPGWSGDCPHAQERAGSVPEMAGQCHRAELNQGPARAAGPCLPGKRASDQRSTGSTRLRKFSAKNSSR